MPLIGAKSVRAPSRGRAHHQFTGGYDLLPTTNRPNRGDNLGSGGSAFHIDALSVSILADIKASIHYMLRARQLLVMRGIQGGQFSVIAIDRCQFGVFADIQRGYGTSHK